MKEIMEVMEVSDVVKHIIKDFMLEQGGISVELIENTVSKPNGESYHGISVKVPDCDMAPTICMDHCIDIVQSFPGNPEDALRSTCDMLLLCVERARAIEPSWFKRYSNVKDCFYVRVCNAVANADFLSTVPHLLKGDMAFYLAFDVCLPSGEEGIMNVGYRLLSDWGIAEEQLFEDAFSSAKALYPMMLEKIPNTENEEGNSGWACACAGDDGAAVLSYPDFYEQIKRETGMSEFYIVPQSRSLLYIIPIPPYSAEECINGIEAMEDGLCFFNEYETAPEEVLSSTVYYCNNGGDFLVAKEAFACA